MGLQKIKEMVSSGQCECAKTRQESSLDCSGHGALVCGRCECDEPYAGQRCHTNLDSSSQNEDRCRPGPNDPVCSNRGKCVEGFCECDQRENPDEKYFGSYCECANFDCPSWNGRYDVQRLIWFLMRSSLMKNLTQKSVWRPREVRVWPVLVWWWLDRWQLRLLHGHRCMCDKQRDAVQQQGHMPVWEM